jgi:uncharacterized protein YoxC
MTSAGFCEGKALWASRGDFDMENGQVALIVILAILVGVLIPSIIQFQSTMRSLNRLIRNNESDVRHTIMQVDRVASHLNRLGSVLESNSKQVESFFESLESLGESIKRFRGAVQTASVLGAAIGPALATAIRARHQVDATSAGGPGDSLATAPREHKLNGTHVGEEEKRK